MRDKVRLPSKFGVTKRQWQSHKRQQVKVARRALEDLRKGSFYTPATEEIEALYKKIKEVEERLSVQQWGSLCGED